jgi:SAM-dependent methyltransferase
MPAQNSSDAQQAFAWQIDIWDRISQTYVSEIDQRFVPVIDHVIQRAELQPGQRVLDLGAGTGQVAMRAAAQVLPGGQVLAVDPSADMLTIARQRAETLGLSNITFSAGRAEEIPADDGSIDVLCASLSLMFAIDKAAAARELGRVLRGSGRLVASVWAGPEECDLVRFQQLAGSFAPAPPAPGVGPGALADPTPFLAQLSAAGIDASVTTETLGFDVDDFAAAWDIFASVTATGLSASQLHAAHAACKAALWPSGDGPRRFRNVALFITGDRR